MCTQQQGQSLACQPRFVLWRSVLLRLCVTRVVQVQGLDAALRAMQHAAASSPDVAPDPGQQQHPQAQQQQEQQQLTAAPAGQPPCAMQHDTSRADQQDAQQQEQLHRHQQLSARSVCSASSSPGQDLPASAAAAKLQQQAQRLSELLAHTTSNTQPGGAVAAAAPQAADGQVFGTPTRSPVQAAQRGGSAGSSGSSTSPQAPAADLLPVQRSSSSANGRLGATETGTASDFGAGAVPGGDALRVTPLVLPPHCAGVREALHDLAAWQLQQGLITQGQAVSEHSSGCACMCWGACKTSNTPEGRTTGGLHGTQYGLPWFITCDFKRMQAACYARMKATTPTSLALHVCWLCLLLLLPQADIVTRKVLQFDPSVGSHGAFVIQEPPSIPSVGSNLSGSAPAHGSSSSNTNQQQQQWAGLVAPLALQLPDYVSPDGAAAHNSSNSRSSSALPGLLDASPWESPTCKQLMDLAAAFDSLAAAPTSLISARHSTITDKSAAASSAGIRGPAASPTGMAPAAAVPAVTAAGTAATSGALGVGLLCDYGVEEVPVDSLDAAQLPVVVQNEKSWSSLHAPSPKGAPAGSGAGALPMMMTHVPAQQQHQQQPPCMQEPSLQLQQEHGSSIMQHQQQQGLHLPVLGQSYVHGGQQPATHMWQQQQQQAWQAEPGRPWPQQLQQQDVQQHQQPAYLVPAGTPDNVTSSQTWGPPAVPASSSYGNEQEQCEMQPQQHMQVHAAAQLGGRQQSWPAQQHAQQEQQWQWQECVRDQGPCGGSGPCQQQAGPPLQHQAAAGAGSDVGGGGLCLAACNAQQLLERFDESLVDLLMEVERLEQQQQQTRRRRQRRQQQQPHSTQQQQWRQPQPLPHPSQQPGCNPQYSQPPLLPAVHARQEPLQLQLHESRSQTEKQQLVWQQQVQPPPPHPLPAGVQAVQHLQNAAWPHGGVAVHDEAEDDEVSEILNC